MNAQTPVDVLIAIQARLNASRTRSIDLFRKIDTGGDGTVSFKELRAGLEALGFECDDAGFRMLVEHLDKDGTDDVSIKELDRALKMAEKEKRASMAVAAPPAEVQERCICGNIFMPDSVYCRKCGEKRPKRQMSMATRGSLIGTEQSVDKRATQSTLAGTRSSTLGTRGSTLRGSMFGSRGSTLRSSTLGTRGSTFLKRHTDTLGYVPAMPEPLGAMDRADEVMCGIRKDLNKRKTRMIDVFHVIDQSGDGILSTAEFRAGLGKLGFRPGDTDFSALVQSLDKDGNGDVSIQEFDKALRLAEKKAKAEGRESELGTWSNKTFEEFDNTNYDWGRRSIRMDQMWVSEFTETNKTVQTDPEKTLETVSETMQMTKSMASTYSVRTVPSTKLGAYTRSWASAANGPLESVLTNKVGNGSLEDASISRQRIFDGAVTPRSWTPRTLPPSLEPVVLRTTHKVDGRFGYEPTTLPSKQLLKNRTCCATALRNSLQAALLGGTKKYPNCPTMQSSVDQIVFNRDMDYSGEDMFDEDFAVMFKGAAGLPSWH